MPTSSSSSGNAPPKSPFFKPSTPHRAQKQKTTITTPGGTITSKKVPKPSVQEHKSSRLGCTANLINAIIGSGIVGIPYAILNAGFVAGILLIVLCTVLTDKSLRLLIATAKHAATPSYETLAEAAFGTAGFYFISVNMFIMAYGAMLSYLMIVKDTFAVAFGVAPDNYQVKRALLCLISLFIIVPLSSQRDMADLAKTSRISVVIDALLVLVVVYQSNVSIDRIDSLAHDAEWLQTDFWIHTETIFIGLGVLSFAFVCQHSAFIIAGSLDTPTVARWSQVTKMALSVCASLALLCGISGYVGFLDNTKGNVINNLQVGDLLSNIARSMLGTTMLFVYPMESFVARHVCVVLLFEGRRAHEGEDANILARRDRRIGLTFALYLSALIPAILFEDLGSVLAATGAVGGSCLSYIGPGAIYLGIHGEDFIELVKRGTWWRRFVIADNVSRRVNVGTSCETTLLIGEEHGVQSGGPVSHLVIKMLQSVSWYLLLMPVWLWIAQIGETTLTKHREDMALKSPHPLRIGNVAPDTPQPQRDKAADRQSDENLSLSWREDMTRADSFKESGMGGGGLMSPLNVGASPRVLDTSGFRSYQTSTPPTHEGSKSTSLNQQIGAKLLASHRKNQHLPSIEKDPQKAPPTGTDFLIAVFFILFGIMALFAGLVSIGLKARLEVPGANVP